MGVERVVSTRVSLTCAGWLPQDGTFESEWAAGLEIERDQLRCNMIAHSRVAGHSQTLAAATEVWFIRTVVGVLVVDDRQ